MERVRISSGSPYEPTLGFSRALRVGVRVFVSGTAPVFPDDSCPEDVSEQTRRCLEIVADALERSGASFMDVVRWRAYITDASDAEAIGRVMGEVFGDTRPTATMVVVAALLDARWKVEIEAEAIVDDA